MAEIFDLLILGAGSAGYAGARTAGALGAKVGLVDKGPLGGLCILRGCMPSKTLLASAEVLHMASRSSEFGLEIPPGRADLPTIIARKRLLIGEFTAHRVDQIHEAVGTALLVGSARFLDAHRVDVDGEVLEAKNILLATGSEITVPDIPGLAETGFITSDDALDLESPPTSLLVLGGGVIAVELGQFYARIGVPTTILQRGNHILSREDGDIAGALHEAFAKEGINVHTRVRVLSAHTHGAKKVLRCLEDGIPRDFEAGEILVATGRHPALSGLDLGAAGVAHTALEVPVDAYLRTNVPHIYAAGDIVGKHYIVHHAILQAETAARNAVSGSPTPLDERLIPWIVFTDPQVARVGLSEREAAEQGRRVIVGTYPFANHGKAMCLGRTDGLVKLVADEGTGEILGAAIAGPEGGELIHELIVAMYFRCTAAQFLAIPHVHPTLAEILTYPAEEIEAKRSASL